MSTYKAIIEERGNGLAGAGDYVVESGTLYRVVSTHGLIHTGPAGRPNYVYGVVEDADWDEIDDDEEEPFCSCVVDVDDEDVDDEDVEE